MTSEEQPTPAVQDPAGQQLRRARESLGLSLEQVADAQHLRPSVIQDIEQGQYERIDSELFLKGYVRAYAKQVHLDADALLATLDQELEPLREQKAREAEANPLISIERKKRQKRRIAKVLGWVVLLGVIIAGATALWDSRQSSDPEPAADEASGELSEPADDNAVTEQAGVAGPEEPEPVTGAVEAAAPNPDPEVGSAPEQAAAEDVVDVAGTGRTENPDATRESDEPGVESDAEAGNREETTAIAPQQQPEGVLASGPMAEPVAPPVPLEMSFTADCWVQVSDANGDQLAAVLKRSGDRLQVEGVPPLTVVVGAVDAVSTIRFDNKPVDMKDFRVRNNRTEFTLEL